MRTTWHIVREHRESFWKTICRLRFLATLVVLILLSSLLSRSWTFEYAGLRSQEILQRAVSPVPAQFSRIVSISSEDYLDLFGERLEAPELRKAILRILDFNPAIVVVDLDTSARRFQQLRRELDSTAQSRIVWARDVEERADNGDLELLPLLGDMDSSNLTWGLALFPRSPDWTVRLYRREFTIGTEQKPSIHWAAVKKFCDVARLKPPACDHIQRDIQAVSLDDDELIVPVMHARYRFEPWHLGDVLDARKQAMPRVAKANDLDGKIVLLGGAYSTQDQHQTPFGIASGVEVVANAVEAELNPHGRRAITETSQIALKVLLALLVAGIHHFCRPFYALWFTMGVLVLLIASGSVLAGLFSGYRADFVPFLLGLLIDQLYTSAERAEHSARLMKASAET